MRTDGGEIHEGTVVAERDERETMPLLRQREIEQGIGPHAPGNEYTRRVWSKAELIELIKEVIEAKR